MNDIASNLSKSYISRLSIALLAFSLVSCSDNPNATAPVAQPASQPAWNLGGVGFKGPIANGQVCVVGASCSDGSSRDIVCTQSDALGNYALTVTPTEIGNSCGPYTMRVTGGSYTDEATGQTVLLTSPLFAYMGESASSVNGKLQRQALVEVLDINTSAAGQGNGVIIDDDAPFPGGSQSQTSQSGTFNVTIPSTMQYNTAKNAAGGLNDVTAKDAQTVVNTALGLNINTNLVQSSPKNGNGSFDIALQSLAQLTSSKGVDEVINSNPNSNTFKDNLGQVQSTLPSLPSNWIFTSNTVPNGQRLTLLPTGEITLPNLGVLLVRRNAGGALEASLPSGVMAIYSWLNGRALTLCGPGNTLLGSLLAPSVDGLIPSDAGFRFTDTSDVAALGCGAVSFPVVQTSGARPPQVPVATTVASSGRANTIPTAGILRVYLRVFSSPTAAATVLGLASVATIPTATLPAGNYLQWAGGAFNATNNYDFGFNSASAVNFMPTPTANGGTGTVSIAVSNADGRVFVRGTAASGNPYVSGFIEPRGFGAMLCERSSTGRLQAVAALTAGLENASTPIGGDQLFGRQWRFVQGCALGANGLGPITQSASAAQGWTNSYAGTLTAAQMNALLLPSSTGVPGQVAPALATDTVFYSAFRVNTNGIVMIERLITAAGETRDIRLFYTVD
ncbi:hypothetical protein [Variovorax sp. PCZ-1]|uniref:hypothetical protein n=1 Tax=Variovorax sp. PCZ-1 TaxID=2835533 RepID=UPI001BCBA6EC|nr:hypothetical protein [Variovorax sp. PCZ-1]MBS7807257.1 hypothetical protein [Variovorax sp. PCZ-1]